MKNQHEICQAEVCHGRPRGNVRAKMLVFQDLDGLTEVFGRMSAGISGPKLPLWADFSFPKDKNSWGCGWDPNLVMNLCFLVPRLLKMAMHLHCSVEFCDLTPCLLKG